MKKALWIICALLLISSMGWAQLKVYESGELFGTTNKLGGITAKFDTPGSTRDTSFASSNVISMTVTLPGGAKQLAKRAWLEVSIIDTNTVANTGQGWPNDTLTCWVYAVGPGGKLSTAPYDTLLFVFSTTPKGQSQRCELTPTGKTYRNQGIATYQIMDIGIGPSVDSTYQSFGIIPYECQFVLAGDCSVAAATSTAARATPWCENYLDTVEFKARLVLDAGTDPVPTAP